MCVWVYFWNYFSLVKFFSFICCTKTKIVEKNHGETFSKKIIISRLPFFISFLSNFLICRLLHFPSCVTRNSKTSQTNKKCFLSLPPPSLMIFLYFWLSFYFNVEIHFILFSLKFLLNWPGTRTINNNKKQMCVVYHCVCYVCQFFPSYPTTNKLKQIYKKN